ncbi:MAG: SRPBCC domain-containing protein [Alphaproteobacteria bacterium]|nr:SRPBCC domain-containing protein [Alphaproteobacteria bacterium]
MTRIAALVLTAALSAPAGADIVSASPDHYELKQEALSALTPGELWDRLVHPELWWHPDHTYSGASDHLSLDPKAGGLWKETWDNGSVAHGTVLTVVHGKMLRLDAPFGPLQDMAVTVIWTITLVPEGKGTRVTFTETANGTTASALDQLAPAIDGVKTEAVERLVSGE